MLWRDLLLVMASLMFFIGLGTFLTGVIILITRAWGRDIHTLTTQTTRLAQKGIAEEVAGLVGNASALLSAINELVRTTTGIGVFLTSVGLILMVITFYLVMVLK